MARPCEGLTDNGRITLFYDEVQILRKALRKLLFNKEKRSMAEEMLIINTYQKLKYKNKNEKARVNQKAVRPNKGQPGDTL